MKQLPILEGLPTFIIVTPGKRSSQGHLNVWEDDAFRQRGSGDAGTWALGPLSFLVGTAQSPLVKGVQGPAESSSLGAC